LITFTEVYSEIGDYFHSKLDHTMSLGLARKVAASLEEEFQDYKVRLEIQPKDDGFALEMGLNSELLLPLLQEIRRLKMEVTSLNSAWGQA
jgi:hypothetical protein